MVAIVRPERVVALEVVVAQRRGSGAEARAVGVVQLAAVATLAVFEVVAGAEEKQQLG
jgi:hypothetical protein